MEKKEERLAMAKTKRAVSIRRVKSKADPVVSVTFGKNTGRLHIDVRLTAAEERGLFNALRKRYAT